MYNIKILFLSLLISVCNAMEVQKGDNNILYNIPIRERIFDWAMLGINENGKCCINIIGSNFKDEEQDLFLKTLVNGYYIVLILDEFEKQKIIDKLIEFKSLNPILEGGVEHSKSSKLRFNDVIFAAIAYLESKFIILTINNIEKTFYDEKRPSPEDIENIINNQNTAHTKLLTEKMLRFLYNQFKKEGILFKKERKKYRRMSHIKDIFYVSQWPQFLTEDKKIRAFFDKKSNFAFCRSNIPGISHDYVIDPSVVAGEEGNTLYDGTISQSQPKNVQSKLKLRQLSAHDMIAEKKRILKKSFSSEGPSNEWVSGLLYRIYSMCTMPLSWIYNLLRSIFINE